MRLLFIRHSFNGLTQRLYCELSRRGHQISGEFDITDAVNGEAVVLFAPDLAERLAAKREQRLHDDAIKPLAAYRQEELQEMHLDGNFYGFDPSYHVARYHFVTHMPHSWTPRHLARHRDLDWKVPV